MTNKNLYRVGNTEQDLRDLLAGLAKSPPANGTVMLLGVTYTLAAYQAKVQGYLTAFDNVNAAHHMLTSSVQVRDAQAAEVSELVEGSHYFLRSVFGSKSPTLEDYGVKPKTPRAKATGAENAARAAKAKATRAKNGTLGPRQKEALDEGTPPSPTK